MTDCIFWHSRTGGKGSPYMHLKGVRFLRKFLDFLMISVISNTQLPFYDSNEKNKSHELFGALEPHYSTMVAMTLFTSYVLGGYSPRVTIKPWLALFTVVTHGIVHAETLLSAFITIALFRITMSITITLLTTLWSKGIPIATRTTLITALSHGII